METEACDQLSKQVTADLAPNAGVNEISASAVGPGSECGNQPEQIAGDTGAMPLTVTNGTEVQTCLDSATDNPQALEVVVQVANECDSDVNRSVPLATGDTGAAPELEAQDEDAGERVVDDANCSDNDRLV